MITDEWVVTAAHCVVNMEANEILVGVHRHLIWSGETNEHQCAENVPVQAKHCHPAYVDGRAPEGYDICLLHLERTISCRTVVAKVRVDDGYVWPRFSEPPYGGGKGTVVGWGVYDPTASNDAPQSLYPREASIDLFTEPECSSFFFPVRGFDHVQATDACVDAHAHPGTLHIHVRGIYACSCMQQTFSNTHKT